MNGRAELALFVAQRASAAVLAPLVLVHIVTMIVVAQHGLSAAEILDRTRGSWVWAGFYGLFVVAAAVHAPIGLRSVLGETFGWRGPMIDLALAVFALFLLMLGIGAVRALT